MALSSSPYPTRLPCRARAAAAHARRGLATLALLGGVLAGPAGAGTVLTVCTEGSPDNFDVAQATTTLAQDAIGRTVYESLLSFRRGTVDTQPGLAEQVDVSPDGRIYTVHLRRGVKFQTTAWFKPTRDMNADDVVFTVQRMMDPKSPWRAVAKAGFIPWNSYGPAEVVKGIERVDDLTVRITLSQPNAPFMGQLALYNIFSIYSAEYGAQLLKAGQADRINFEPVGTGPWALRSYQKDASIRLVAHPDYWGGKPKIDTIVMAITPDANVRVQRLRAGECLVGANMRAETLGSFEGTDVEMRGQPGLVSSYITINTKRPYLSDKRFREALWLGFDKATYIKAVYGGRARPSANFLPPPVWGHDADLPDRKPDLERARALVQASGYDGREIVIMTRVGGSFDAKRAAELMQSDWARIGVKTRVQMVEWVELLKRASAADYDLSFLSWTGGGDPDDYLGRTLTCKAVQGGNNRSQWCNPAFDELIDTARASPDRARRIELYRKAQRILYDEMPIIPTVYPEIFIALNKRVKGYVSGPLADLDFRGVTVSDR